MNVQAPSEDESNDNTKSVYKGSECVIEQLYMWHMEFMLREFNEKVGRENIF